MAKYMYQYINVSKYQYMLKINDIQTQQKAIHSILLWPKSTIFTSKPAK